MTYIFDDTDTFYLANNFNLVQLRQEIQSAELKASMANIFAGTKYQEDIDIWPWQNFADTCRKAIKWNQASKSVNHLSSGHINVNAIKEKSDIVALVGNYTKLQKTGKNFIGLCPFHDEKHPSFLVYPEQQRWQCFGACNTSGDVIDFVRIINNTDFKGAIAILRGS